MSFSHGVVPRGLAQATDVVEMPSLQVMAAAALMETPGSRDRRRFSWGHSKKWEMLCQFGYRPIVRTSRNRSMWNTAVRLRVFPSRMPDLVLEVRSDYWPGEEEMVSVIRVAYAASEFTTGAILRLKEAPEDTIGCVTSWFSATVERVREIHHAIDSVDLDDVVWKEPVSICDIENRCVKCEAFQAPCLPNVVCIASARTNDLEYYYREPIPDPPPARPPLRRSKRKTRDKPCGRQLCWMTGVCLVTVG